MTRVRRDNDCDQYLGVRPYVSELFGVYRPLLGWKSQRFPEQSRIDVNAD